MLLPFLALFLFQTPNEPKPATLEGSVVHASSKVTIRKAKVLLSGIGIDSETSVETGDDGKFTLKDVKPGRYRLRAEKTGYQTTAYGARKAGEAVGQVLRVDAGASLSGLQISVAKDGVIAGKILDADGEPVSRALVMALSNMYIQNGRRSRVPRGTVPALSNDLGEYRVGQLPPGKYIICAVPVGSYQPAPQTDKEVKPVSEEADVTTCFPNVRQLSDATPFEIKDASEIPSVDIRLAKTRTVTVQGKIAGLPASSGGITILNLNTKGAGPMGNVTNPRAMLQGGDSFTFKNVAPGSYILHTLPTGLGNAPFVVKTEVEVGDKPMADLVVPAIVPFDTKVKINAEPGPQLKISSIRVMLQSADDITPAVAMGTAGTEGDLTLSNMIPGRHRVAITGTPDTHYVREIRVGDRAIEGDEIDIASPGTLVSIALAVGHGEIGGLVKNEKGEPVPGAYVALVPRPRQAFRGRTGRTDQSGIFKLGNVAPGEYLLAALDMLENGALQDEEFLKPIAPKMKTIKVEDGGTVAQELTILHNPSDQ